MASLIHADLVSGSLLLLAFLRFLVSSISDTRFSGSLTGTTRSTMLSPCDSGNVYSRDTLYIFGIRDTAVKENSEKMCLVLGVAGKGQRDADLVPVVCHHLR